MGNGVGGTPTHGSALAVAWAPVTKVGGAAAGAAVGAPPGDPEVAPVPGVTTTVAAVAAAVGVAGVPTAVAVAVPTAEVGVVMSISGGMAIGGAGACVGAG